MNRLKAILVMVALVGACDSSSDVTLLGTTTPTTVPVSFDGDSLVGTPYPSGGGRWKQAGIGYQNGLWLVLGGRSPFGGSQLWASTDGVTWEPRTVSEFGDATPGSLLAVEDGGWVVTTSPRAYDGSGWGSWFSHDGETWTPIESEWTLGGFPTYATEGQLAMGVTHSMSTSGDDGTFFRSALYTTDGGRSWLQAPIDGKPRAAAAIDGDLIVGGTRERVPMLWRLSNGWRPEPLEGLGSEHEVTSLMPMPDGSRLLIARTAAVRGARWYVSEDIKSWSEMAAPEGLPVDVEVQRRGPFLVARPEYGYGDNREWVSVNGTDWTEILEKALYSTNRLEGHAFASDGSTLIGAGVRGLVSDHPVVFTGPQHPGAWEELATVPGVLMAARPQFWGQGGNRYLVRQGKVEEFRAGELVPLPDPPVVVPDTARLYATESALFLVSWDEAWVFRDGEWGRSNLPLERDPCNTEGSNASVVERGGVFITMTIEDREVRKYVSDDGAVWRPARTDAGVAETVCVDWDGWFRATSLGELIVDADGSYYDNTDLYSVDGSEWISREIDWRLPRAPRVDGEIVTFPRADGDFEFAFPAEARFLYPVGWSSEAVLLVVERDGVPYLLVIAADGEQIWAPQDVFDPPLSDAWFDGTHIYATDGGMYSDRMEASIYFWNPDAG